MKIESKNVEDYISKISIEQKDAFQKIRKAILKTIDKQFEECIQYNMVSYVVPKSVYPEGYHCDPSLPLPFASLAAQKSSVNLYHMGIYSNPELLDWWKSEYSNHCNAKLDIGKSCIRFKKYDDIPFDLISKLFSKMTAKEWANQHAKSLKK
jgi:uncharacterized protein YdhG (YjbR/CyaY superfamily)